MPEPSTNGENGKEHDENGRFLPGNPGGPGNPGVKRLARWREAVRRAVTFQDVKEVLRVLVKAAKAGDRWAVEYLLSRTLPDDWSELQRDERAESERDKAQERFILERFQAESKEPLVLVPGLPPLDLEAIRRGAKNCLWKPKANDGADKDNKAQGDGHDGDGGTSQRF